MILLFNPASSASRKPVLPMSLLALGAVLEGRYDYRLVDGNLVPDPLAHLHALIAETQATVLAVTVMPGPQLQQAVPLCRELKRRHPDLTIVWGGYFPTQHWDVCLRSDVVDYVVRGHGELVFLQLLSHLETGTPPRSEIQGLAYREANEAHALTGSNSARAAPLAPMPHPARLPDFPYQRLDIPRYLRRTFLGARTLAHHSSYGCPFFCNFCAVVNMVNGRWLAQPAERVARVVEDYVARWGVDAVEFYDNNFFVHEARTLEFAERVQAHALAWWGESRIDTLLRYAQRTWQRMRASGLRMVFLGAESGSAETLKRMDKGGTLSPEKTLEIARLMRAWDIVPEFSFVIGNPPDPEADARLTMEFIRRVKRVNPRAEIIMYLYTPVPLAGDLYDEARATGFHFPETLEAWVSPRWLDFTQRRSTTLPWMTPSLAERLHEFERVLNAYYPTATNLRLRGLTRAALRLIAAPRYHLRLYRFPLELRALHRVLAYQRPETSGF